jgi:hypothetical protein
MRRRRPIERWSPQQLVDHVEVAFAYRYEETNNFLAALVLHQDPRLLPRRSAREAMDEGQFFPDIVLEYATTDGAMVAWGMSRVIEDDMLVDVAGFTGKEQVRKDAAERLPNAEPLSFGQLPDIIRAAFIHGTRGTQPSLEL